jgi:hypothetical protein
MPRRPAAQPWRALGISKSSFYRLRKKAREREALALETSRRQKTLDRSEAFAMELARHLDRCAALDVEVGAIIVELAAVRPVQSFA